MKSRLKGFLGKKGIKNPGDMLFGWSFAKSISPGLKERLVTAWLDQGLLGAYFDEYGVTSKVARRWTLL